MKKLKSAAGFTMGEMLVAILILLMAAVVVMRGVPAAKAAYEKVTMSANAQLLLSTTVSSLRDQLSTAKDVKVSDKTVTYYSADTGNTSQISVAEDGVIMLQEYMGNTVAGDTVGDEEKPAARQLVTAKASTAELSVTYSGVSYADGVVTFTGLEVGSPSGGTILADLDTLMIRVVSAN